MKKALHILLFSISAQVTVSAFAAPLPGGMSEQQEEPRWFQADMVVFLNQKSMNDQSPFAEKWPEISPHTVPTHAVALKKPELQLDTQASGFLSLPGTSESIKTIDITRDAFVSLPVEKHTLQQQDRTLERQSGYKVLSRTAWLMPIKDDSTTQSVKLKAYSETGQPSLLEGSVSVSSSRFLHVDVDLWYSELSHEGLSTRMIIDEELPVTEEQTEGDRAVKKKPVIHRNLQLVTAPSGTPMKITRNFRINERRRIRNTEQVHYIDSPVVGVLFKLTPYERPDAPLLPEIDAFSPKNQYGQQPTFRTEDNS
ncbi:MAG: CsiV family protein [Endozoicomonas sp.]